MTREEEIRREKAVFVREELTAMLRAATAGYVRECWYEAHGAREVVTVAHGGRGTGPGGPMRLQVDVTADSPWAVAKDVMRAVAEVWE